MFPFAQPPRRPTEVDVMETKARLAEAADMIQSFATSLGTTLSRTDDIVAGFAMHLFHEFDWLAFKDEPAQAVDPEAPIPQGPPASARGILDWLSTGTARIHPGGFVVVTHDEEPTEVDVSTPDEGPSS